MPINYLTIKRAAALRLAQIVGTSQATLETAYSSAWASMLDGAEIPETAFKDQILAIERELVQLVGNNASHPARSDLYGQSAPLSDLSQTPINDSTGALFFGVFDSVSDAVNNRPLTLVPTQTITDILDNGASFFKADYYWYSIVGNFLRCTRPSVILQGVSWDYTVQAGLYDTNGDSPLPEGLEATWIDGVSARAAQVGWIAGDLFGYYNNLYQAGRQNFNMIGGNPNVPLASQNAVAG